jgi:hypothetical protein
LALELREGDKGIAYDGKAALIHRRNASLAQPGFVRHEWQILTTTGQVGGEMDPLHFFSKGLSSALWTEIYFFDNSVALHCAINCRHDKMRAARRFAMKSLSLL